MNTVALKDLLGLDFDPEREPIRFLRHLHAQRFSDREIAECLNDPPQYLFHKHAHIVENPLAKEEPPQRWTADRVFYMRKKLSLKGHRKPRRDIQRVSTMHRSKRLLRASRWLNLGIDLYPAQVDILNTLKREGPLTMRQIMTLTGRQTIDQQTGQTKWKWPRLPDGSSAIARLVEAGVLTMQDVPEEGRVVRQYALAEGVKPESGERGARRLTGVERRFLDLGLIEDRSGSLPSVHTSVHSRDFENFFDDSN